MKKLIYQFVIYCCCLISPIFVLAQQNLPWDLWQNPSTNDFTTIQQQVEAYFEGKDTGRESGYKQWKRWEEFNHTRLDNDGRIVNVAARNYAAFKRQKYYTQSMTRNVQGDWKSFSATEYTANGSWSPGIGRINTIAFHPSDPNTLFVGTPAGGLFKTTNHGDT